MPQNENEYHDDENGEAADEDDEDITLKENDHVLLAGIDSPDGTANIEVRLPNLNGAIIVKMPVISAWSCDKCLLRRFAELYSKSFCGFKRVWRC